jgi:hypothetical protein
MATGQASPKVGKVIDIPANAPTIGTATDLATDGAVSVAFTAGSTTTGGPVFSYSALSNPGSITVTGSTSPITMSGLTNSTAYTFTVRGVNATGAGPYSAASNSATPTLNPGYFESISTGVGTGSNTTITFSSIPSTYKYLQIRGFYVCNNSSDDRMNMLVKFNGDTTSTNQAHFLRGRDVGVDSFNDARASGNFVVWNSGYSSIATSYLIGGVSIIDIHDYASTTKYKTVRSRGGIDDSNVSAGSAAMVLGSALWENTSAINSITLTSQAGTFTTNTKFALYGIKG